MFPDPLNILLVEDLPQDAELALRELRRAGLRCTGRRVDTQEHFIRALDEAPPDVILSDFSMPNFDGMTALAIARRTCPATPFIFVSGTLGEEYAIRALKSGATDYVLKDNLVRLPPTVERAVQEARALEGQRRAQAALQASEQRFKLAASTGDLWDWTVATGEAYISQQWKQRLGYEDHEVENTAQAWLGLVHPTDRETVMQVLRTHITRRTPCEVEYRAQHRDGSYRWLHARGQALWNEDGRAVYMAGTVSDVTERKLAEMKVRHLHRVHAMLSGIHSLIVRAQSREELFREACRIAVDAGEFRLAWIGLADREGAQVVPTAWHGLGESFIGLTPLGLDPAQPASFGFAGQTMRRREAMVLEDMLADPRMKHPAQAQALGLRSLAMLPLQVGRDAVGVLALYTEEPAFFDAAEMKLLMGLTRDIAFAIDHIDKTDRLNHLAYYDPLTGLPNRRLLMDRLRRTQLNSSRQRTFFAVLFVDLDDFKQINDRHGHDAGDRVLVEVAARLQAAVRQNDTVARLGGDEFVAVLEDLGPLEDLAQDDLDGISAKILSLVEQDHLLGEMRLSCLASIGVRLLWGSELSVEQVLKEADTAMYRVKNRRKQDAA